MANYVFDTITQTDASAFGTADSLYFLSATVSGLGVVDSPATSTSTALGTTLTDETITLTSGGKSLTFGATALATASQAQHLIFLGSTDSAVFGTDASADPLTAHGVAGHGAVVFGFGGADTITGSLGNDTLNGGEGNDVISSASTTTESDYLLGGNGADTITGGAGNDHIYGNLFTSTAGATDGNDVIDAGDGNDYVNGNAGNDNITAGNGNDRVYGGNGDDTLTGGNGYDYLQGNKGNDSIDGGADNDTIHGGADNDILLGGAGNDQLFGDAGNDTLTGGAGYDVLTGGNGADVFSFGVHDALNTTIGTTAVSVDVIADFTDGTDTIHLIATSGTTTATFVPTAILHTGSGATFTDVAAAQTYAQQLLDASTGTHGSEVAAITVGSDTYLFWSDAGTTATTINEAVKVTGVLDTAFTTADFV